MEKNDLLWETLKIIEHLPVGEWIEQIGKTVERTYGLIHMSAPAEIHGVKGFLIWDYIVFNEITFKDIDGKIVSLYKGFSDKETEDRWNELVERFGVKIE